MHARMDARMDACMDVGAISRWIEQATDRLAYPPLLQHHPPISHTQPAHRANRASGEALTEVLMQEVTKEFRAARPGELQMPEYFAWKARRLVEEFKVKVMGTPVLNKNPSSQQQRVMKQTVERVSLGELHGVDIQVRG
jgi:hypothetical protein